jgi:hypothetical protein
MDRQGYVRKRFAPVLVLLALVLALVLVLVLALVSTLLARLRYLLPMRVVVVVVGTIYVLLLRLSARRPSLLSPPHTKRKLEILRKLLWCRAYELGMRCMI